LAVSIDQPYKEVNARARIALPHEKKTPTDFLVLTPSTYAD
jgi:hypothetical protein